MTGRRIAKLEIENFKGFTGRLSLDMDAEIVLLVGANGRGKTSTIEALELIATGTIFPRIGDHKDFTLSDFVHRDREEGATTRIIATWKNEPRQETAIIDPSSQHEPSVSGPLEEERKKRDNDAEDGLTRACTFLYSDSIGGLAGLDRAARRSVIDLFVPREITRLNALTTEQATLLSNRLKDSLRRIESRLPNREERKSKETTQAIRAGEAWNATVAADERVQFTKRGPLLLAEQSLRRALRQVCTRLNIESPPTGDYTQQLRGISEAAATKSHTLEDKRKTDALAASAIQGAWASVQSVVRQLERQFGRSGLLSPDAAIERQRQLGTAEELHERELSIRENIAATKRSISELCEEQPLSDFPMEIGTLKVGILPLLATLARLNPATPLPEWWKEMGLPQPDPARFSALLSREAQRWSELQQQANELNSKLVEVETALKELGELGQLIPLLDELSQAWTKADMHMPLPIDEEHRLSTGSIRKAAEDALSAIAPTSLETEHEITKWRAISDAFSAWADARAAVLDAEQIWNSDETIQSTHNQIREALSFAETYLPRRFSADLRSCIAKQRYQSILNRSLQNVLRWYAHRSDAIAGARINFHDQGPIQVRVGTEEDSSTGIASLSRSQLTSLAFGLAVVANLGHPTLPTGFLCLDDVSDAFDLDNLAADAALLRLLAYGENVQNGNGRRQLIITNHNDELTDRLVPLLLPPAGKRMLIIEFTDDGPGKPVRPRQWEVQAEQSKPWERRSPLRALLKEADTESSTGQAE